MDVVNETSHEKVVVTSEIKDYKGINNFLGDLAARLSHNPGVDLPQQIEIQKSFAEQSLEIRRRTAAILAYDLDQAVLKEDEKKARAYIDMARVLNLSQNASTSEEESEKINELLTKLEGFYPPREEIDESEVLNVDKPILPQKKPKRFGRRPFIQKAMMSTTVLGVGGLMEIGGKIAWEIFSQRDKSIKPVVYKNNVLLEPIKKPPTTTSLPTPEPSPTETKVPTPTTEPTKVPTATVTQEPIKTATSKPTSTLEPTSTPEPTIPTPEVIDEGKAQARVEREIGEMNLAEYFLEDLVKKCKGRGITIWENDPGYRERVSKEAVLSDNLTFVYLGVDDTRERINEHNDQGWGRSDVIMVVNINPHTLDTVVISIPRDLLSKEVAAGGTGWDKINSATQSSYLKQADPRKYGSLEDSYPLMQRILESATGLRIDGMISTNIDAIQGFDDYFDQKGEWHEGRDGLIDTLLPEGLKIKPSKDLVDTQYPRGYGTITVRFKAGQDYELHGRELTQYSRMRHSDSDYGRSERQREVVMGAFFQLFPQFAKDVLGGDIDILDRVISSLSEQQNLGNLFQHYLDFIEVLKTMKDSVLELRKQPDGDKKLALLAANTLRRISEVSIKSWGLNGADEVKLVSYNGSTNALAGPGINSTQSEFGNYIKYWTPLREKVLNLVGF